MNRFKRITAAFGSLFLSLASLAWAGTSVTMDGPMTDAKAAVGVSGATMTYTLNLDDHNIDYMSMQIVVASDTLSNVSFNDGAAASEKITVVTPTGLSSATASAKMTISSNTALNGQSLFIAGNNIPFRVDLITSSNTACNTAADIAAQTVFLATCAVNNSKGIIYSTAPAFGSSYNSFSMESSSLAAISSAAFSGGQDNAQLCINGTCLKANTHWFPTASAGATASSLYAAINSSFTIVKATATGTTGVIYTTATTVGTGGNYSITSSSDTPLLLGNLISSSPATGFGTASYLGGLPSSFTISGQNISIASHGLPLGLGVSVSTAAGTQQLFYSTASVGGTSVQLAHGTTYFVIPIDANTIALATTSSGAVAGQAITFVSSGTNTTTDTYTLVTPAAAGAATMGTFMSNDGVNFTQVTSTATISTYVFPSSSTFYDYGNVDYKWVKLSVTPPITSGAVSIKAIVHGEKR